MNFSDYIPLLIVFVVVFSSAVKGTRKKRQIETAKTTLPGHKSGKEIRFPKASIDKKVIENVQVKSNKLKTKITPIIEPTVLSTNSVGYMEKEEVMDSFFSTGEIDEIRKAIVYTEIFNRKENY